MKKQEIIEELKKIAKRLNKSPGRREIPFKLYYHCIKQFKFFNKAKQGLPIRKRPHDPLPKRAYKFTKDLSRITSYLTFDGHLYKDLTAFQAYSKNIQELKNFEKIVKRQFGIKAHYKLNYAGSKRQTHVIEFFNAKANKFLNQIGVPKGDKSITKYRIPLWIKRNKEFSRNYLKIAYLCEGSWKENDRPNPRIKFNMHKSKKLIKNGILFLKDLKDMLKGFGIETTPISIHKGKTRKDGIITKK